MKDSIQKIAEAAEKEIAAARPNELEKIRIKYLGRKSELTSLLRSISYLPENKRPKMGQLANQLKTKIEAMIEKKAGMVKGSKSCPIDKDRLDTTVTPSEHLLGSHHPISQIKQKLERFFASIGFEIMDTPHMEDDYHNFEGLNIPLDHPARDAHDTFWMKNGRLLRTHTSTMQVYSLKTRKPPIYTINLGRCYRYEDLDASHENTFNQIDGFMVDKGIGMNHLLGVLQSMFEYVFERDVKVRFRPSYFPFVEPGAELDLSCLICDMKGCSTCKGTGWIEMLGCGITHPSVLKIGKLDTHKYTAWAFGMGIDRLTMMYNKINDIRLFNGADLRELRQF